MNNRLRDRGNASKKNFKGTLEDAAEGESNGQKIFQIAVSRHRTTIGAPYFVVCEVPQRVSRDSLRRCNFNFHRIGART